MIKKKLIFFVFSAAVLLFGFSIKANSTPTISVNNNEMLSDGKTSIYWNISSEPEYCGVDYGLNSDLSGATGTNGSLIQVGLPTNDGKFYYVVNLSGLQVSKDYYYKVVCTLKDDNAVYQSDIKKLAKYEITATEVNTGDGNPVISIDSDFGGKTLSPGQTITIKWKQTNVDEVSIGYLFGPNRMDWIKSSYPVDINNGTGSYSWKIPVDAPVCSDCQIMVKGYHTGVGSFEAYSEKFSVKSSIYIHRAEMISANKAVFSVSTSVKPESCGIDYSLNSDLSYTVRANGGLVQSGLATNDGQFYYAIDLPDLQAGKDYYYRPFCFYSDGFKTGEKINKLNKYDSQVITNELPDLTIQDISLSPSLVVGQNDNFELGIKVINLGSKDVTDKINIGAAIYDGVNESKKLIAYFDRFDIGINPFPINIPKFYSEKTSGPFKTSKATVIAWVDKTGGVYKDNEEGLSLIKESNENNNLYTKIFDVKNGIEPTTIVTKTTDDSVSTNTVIKTVAPISVKANSDDNSVVLKLQRTITELETKVIELEKSLTKLDKKFAAKYSGTMFLDVQNQGHLWYVDPASKNRFYFQDGESALSIGSELATGITYENLQKIPVGVPDSLYNLTDTDGDGLSDNLEVALGTDPNKADTDGDSRSDKTELLNSYNPVGSQKYVYDQKLIDKLEGKMMLQVSGPNSHGEIWYIYKGKRWYGGTKDSMYEIMKSLSLGATADNIRKILVGEIVTE